MTTRTNIMSTDDRPPRPASRLPLSGTIVLSAGLLLAVLCLAVESWPAPLEEPANPLGLPTGRPWFITYQWEILSWGVPSCAGILILVGIFLMIRSRRAP